MSRTLGIRTRTLARVTLTICFGLMTHTPMSASIQAGKQNVSKPAARALEGTYWKAIQLAGKATPAQDGKHEAHVILEGGRLAGSDGCNRILGSYDLKGDSIKFALGPSTQMACTNTGETERAFRHALTNAARFTIVGDRLELLNGAGKRIAAFAGRAAAVAPGGSLLLSPQWNVTTCHDVPSSPVSD
jgi:heat shock protein HslJ